LLVYVNHGLRPEAEAEGARVQALAKAEGARCLVQSIVVPEQASLEAAARDARYAALDQVAEENEIDWILLGHTRSDQAETVLMRVLRGTGLVGLAGIPRHRGRYARPLMGFTRRDTEAYCRQHELEFVEDPMNRDSRFTRVRVRHHWLPALRKENPQVDDALVRLAESAADHRDVLDWAAERFLLDALEGQVLTLGPDFDELPEGLATRVLVLHAEKSGVRGLESRHLVELLALARAESSGSRELNFPGSRVRRTYAALCWNPEPTVATSVTAPEGYQPRHWRPGDRMRPERLKGRSRKLSDLFGDAKIPKELRARAWVVERSEDGEIVWAEHIGHAFGSQLSVSLGQDPDESAK
jgi:tRNA(Ile)-lysidine synthase